MSIKFTLNGRTRTVACSPSRRVVDLLREDLRLTGTKEACGSGECGACTIVVDGTTKLACLTLAAQLQDCQVMTIEGLGSETDLTSAAGIESRNVGSSEPELSYLQTAFIEGGAVQCGFCTPGMLLTAHNLLSKTSSPDENEVRTAISGNLCRCTGYQKIVESIMLAAKRRSDDGD